MNTKEKTTQTSKRTERQVRKPASTEAALPPHQITTTPAEPTRRKQASAKALGKGNSLPAQQVTMVEAKIDVGLGNRLFIRGQGDGLNWFEGVPLNCVDTSRWVWSSTAARGKVVFKLLLNDQVWAKGEDVVVESGRTLEVVPFF